MNSYYSPALSPTSDISDLTDEELDRYFANYAPLSNLPTPPPAKQSPVPSVLPTTPRPIADAQAFSPELEAYAAHLTHLVPLNVSTQRPSLSCVSGFLARARLPDEMIAFAACVLDALSQRFASSWRDACGLSKTTEKSRIFSKANARHQSCPSPEVIILAALALAQGFLDDRGRSTSHWARVEAQYQFSVEEIEVSKMCVLQDIDYGLFRIGEEMVQRMVRNLQRVGCSSTTSTTGLARQGSVTASKEQRRPNLLIGLQGTAVWEHGIQTPEPSP